MRILRTIVGALIGAAVILILCRLVPFSPDLTDWGGRSFPRLYLLALLILALIGYFGGWSAARVSPSAGRISGMLASLIAGVLVIGWDLGAPLLKQLFHHPAYPVFSDHALLALAALLVGGHLGGLRVERGAMNRCATAPKHAGEPSQEVP